MVRDSEFEADYTKTFKIRQKPLVFTLKKSELAADLRAITKDGILMQVELEKLMSTKWRASFDKNRSLWVIPGDHPKLCGADYIAVCSNIEHGLRLFYTMSDVVQLTVSLNYLLPRMTRKTMNTVMTLRVFSFYDILIKRNEEGNLFGFDLSEMLQLSTECCRDALNSQLYLLHALDSICSPLVSLGIDLSSNASLPPRIAKQLKEKNKVKGSDKFKLSICMHKKI